MAISINGEAILNVLNSANIYGINFSNCIKYNGDYSHHHILIKKILFKQK